MTASGAGLNVTSAPFVISPATVAAISFVNQPGTTNAGNVIGPVTAQALDAFGNPVANMAIGMALGGGSFSSGTTTMVTNTLGQAVFGNLITKTVGSYTLAMSATGVSARIVQFLQRDHGRPDAVLCHPAGERQQRRDDAHRRRPGDRQVRQRGVGPGVNLTLSSGALTGTTTAITDATGQASFSKLVDHARRHGLHADGIGDRPAQRPVQHVQHPGPARHEPDVHERSRPAPRPAATSAR